MTSEEYVNQVNRLLDLQNTYLGIFLGILGAVIGIMGIFQWRFSSRQMEQLKEKTKRETIREIEEYLGVSSLAEFKRNIENNIDNIGKNYDAFEDAQLDYELNKLYMQDEIPLWHLTYLMDIYKCHILKSFKNFDYVVSRIASLIFVGNNENKIDMNTQSAHINNIIRKMTEFEKKFNENSEKLERFRNEIKYHKNQE